MEQNIIQWDTSHILWWVSAFLYNRQFALNDVISAQNIVSDTNNEPIIQNFVYFHVIFNS